MKYEVIDSGVCICTAAPMGTGGLEGYMEDEEYKFKEMRKIETGERYYRVYHQRAKDEKPYYETCGPGIFSQHFKKQDDQTHSIAKSID